MIEPTLLQNTEEASSFTENLYLKFFKISVVALMSLALLALVVLIPMIAYNAVQSPREPMPEQAAPTKTINVDDLRKFLIDAEKRKKDAEKSGKPLAPADEPTQKLSTVQKYTEYEAKIFACTRTFSEAVNASADVSEKEIAAARENRRSNIENYARNKLLGEPWVVAMTDFVCQVLTNPGVIAAHKAGDIAGVTGPTILFHARAYANIEQEKINFSNAEKARIGKEYAAEAIRVAKAEANTLKYSLFLACAFGLFFALALYLIFAKIELNLRDISAQLKGKVAP